MSRHSTASSVLKGAISPKSKPLVSVIIPAYQVSGFIQETLQSVLNQTYGDYEVIVINDGSPDTPLLEEQIQPHSHLITYLKQSNGGAGAARNAGIRVAQGQSDPDRNTRRFFSRAT
ncbi:MAG TPA: glycosyltransferase family 2 protein [Pyrinomonadaceae bacterium]|nr:glycosyltransferase family 2 protein [Pyrinomonadaceae bacterium]